jgi:hypothetical protein
VKAIASPPAIQNHVLTERKKKGKPTRPLDEPVNLPPD